MGATVADTIPIRSETIIPSAPTSAPDPLVVDAARLAPLLTVSVRTVRTWDAGGKLPSPVRIGGRVVWRMDEIRAWLAAGAPDRLTWDACKAVSRK